MKYTSFEKKPLAFYRRASGRLIDRLLGITSRKCGHYEWQVWLVRYGFAWGKSCQGDLRVKEQEGNRGGHCAMVRIHMPHHGLTHTHTYTRYLWLKLLPNYCFCWMCQFFYGTFSQSNEKTHHLSPTPGPDAIWHRPSIWHQNVFRKKT